MIHYQDLVSSAMSGAKYNTETKDLILFMTHGETLVYSGVPESVFLELIKSQSSGKYYNQHIRDSYPVR